MKIIAALALVQIVHPMLRVGSNWTRHKTAVPSGASSMLPAPKAQLDYSVNAIFSAAANVANVGIAAAVAIVAATAVCAAFGGGGAHVRGGVRHERA